MTETRPYPTIFISYSWKNERVADEIDKYFSSIGLNLTRDIRDSKYRTSIKEFMKKIKDTDFVLMLISKEFLESPNCMYEAMEMFKNKNYKKRFLPIVIENACCFKPLERKGYIKFWENEYDKLNNEFKDIKNLDNIDESLREDLKIHKDISGNIGKILGIISSLNAKTYDAHKNSNFKEILELIGFEDSKLIEELFGIINLTDNIKILGKLDIFLSNHPNHKGGLFYKAYIYSEMKEYETAILLWDYYLTKIKDDFRAWYNKGIDLGNLEQYEKAIECYDKALEIKPDDYYAYDNKGIALGNLEQYEKAIECYDKALEIKPDLHEAWNNKGFALGNLEQYEKAIECYDKALEIKPDFHEAWNNKGIALGNLEQYEKAIICYEKGIKIKSDKYLAWNNKGTVLAKLEQYEKAIECFDKALAIKPDFHLAWNNKGFAFGNLEQNVKAIECFDKVLEIKPDDHQVWDNKGYTLCKMGKYEEALYHHKKAIDIKLDFADAWYNMACVYALMNNKEEMLKNLKTAIELDNINKEDAKTDEDFKAYWDDPDFKKLVE
jgi:tetratricopeptide (TPR) repeat protein